MTATPFLLKLFYRTGAFHRPDEFSSPQRLAFVPVYALPSYTLSDLTYYLAAAQNPAVLPSTCIGTRIVFRHVYENTRHAAEGNGSGNCRPSEAFKESAYAPRFIIKDVGSVVIGSTGPGAPTTSLDAIDDAAIPDELMDDDEDQLMLTGNAGSSDDDGSRTLAKLRYTPGEYLSCAILPPLADGCVAPASSARSGRGSGVGEAPPSRMPPPPLSGASAVRSMDSRFSGRRGRDGYGASSNYGVPTAGWRRGDAIPDEGAWVRDGGQGGSRMGWRDSQRRRDSRW
ncbi:sin3-associated polypeptide [Sporothrix brasiliensis 5110]|uniref:Sin3-associated polypeptide n=1 Tax=Sporothrix brasiliensis 5110 TaxID=1398154 RepID=A0A0C2FPW8_9PEZI|nr:sin3-associated polypeptide [Sporothrix brasiliensis 5110]KIH93093.1 sin3-associated polypeptide [Sporothrix brasiliensis 5110]